MDTRPSPSWFIMRRTSSEDESITAQSKSTVRHSISRPSPAASDPSSHAAVTVTVTVSLDWIATVSHCQLRKSLETVSSPPHDMPSTTQVEKSYLNITQKT
eukprot:TRINITY_DN3142_c1_g1_i1.p1 TRINITY_DN3142_c1_g1~~TRINITY_DN3142_c1_g1_i1.p1  ORF type:complete len:101 (+),score=12.54 TRINITY_DN3142_c1_g1_i1:135-437(+)